MRDMTQQQFAEALARHGMKEQGFMGYVDVGIPGHSLHVSKLNAGSRRRSQLAYLLAAKEREMAECKCGHPKLDHHFPVRDPQTKKITGTRCSKCECGVPAPPPEQGTVLREGRGEEKQK